MFTIKISDEILDKLRTMLEDEDEGTGVRVNFHSKCKMLGGVAEFFSAAFLCRFPPEDLPRPVVYPVHSLPV